MSARAVDDAAIRLRELRREESENLGLAALSLGLAVAAAELRPAFALPLFLGGLVVWTLGIRALYRRWDLVDRLLEERAAYAIAEVAGQASRIATIESRRRMACAIRTTLADPGLLLEARVHATADQLDELAADLDDGGLVLDPACAVACRRLLYEYAGSPLLDPAVPPEELRSRLNQIRSGFVGRAAGECLAARARPQRRRKSPW
jgi:hypothetical protein